MKKIKEELDPTLLLPYEIWIIIASFLTYTDFESFSQTSHFLRKIRLENQLWKNLTKKYVPPKKELKQHYTFLLKDKKRPEDYIFYNLMGICYKGLSPIQKRFFFILMDGTVGDIEKALELNGLNALTLNLEGEYVVSYLKRKPEYALIKPVAWDFLKYNQQPERDYVFQKIKQYYLLVSSSNQNFKGLAGLLLSQWAAILNQSIETIKKCLPSNFYLCDEKEIDLDLGPTLEQLWTKEEWKILYKRERKDNVFLEESGFAFQEDPSCDPRSLHLYFTALYGYETLFFKLVEDLLIPNNKDHYGFQLACLCYYLLKFKYFSMAEKLFKTEHYSETIFKEARAGVAFRLTNVDGFPLEKFVRYIFLKSNKPSAQKLINFYLKHKVPNLIHESDIRGAIRVFWEHQQPDIDFWNIFNWNPVFEYFDNISPKTFLMIIQHMYKEYNHETINQVKLDKANNVKTLITTFFANKWDPEEYPPLRKEDYDYVKKVNRELSSPIDKKMF